MGHSALWHYGQVNPLFVVFFQFWLQVEGFLGQNYINLMKNAQKKRGRDGGGPHYGYQTSEARLTHFFAFFFNSGFRLRVFRVKPIQQ